MKQSEHREKPIKRRRVQRNRRAEDRKIVIMWVKRIAVAVMVMLLLGQAYRLVAIYQEKQHIEQQLQELQQKLPLDLTFLKSKMKLLAKL